MTQRLLNGLRGTAIPLSPIFPALKVKIEPEAVISRLKQLGYEALDADLALIEYTSHKVTQEIFNYCNIRSLPRQLIYEATDAVCGEILRAKLSTNSIPNLSDVISGVSAIKQGDSQITFSDKSTQVEQLITLLASLELDKTQLDRFRRMAW